MIITHSLSIVDCSLQLNAFNFIYHVVCYILYYLYIYTCQSVAKQTSEFAIDWESASLCVILRDGTCSQSKGDFAIKLTHMIEAGSNTGYIAQVKRRIDMAVKYVDLANM